MPHSKVLLINPPLIDPHLPTALLSLASYVKDIAEVEILDLGWERIGKKRFIKDYIEGKNLTRRGFNCVGITGSTLQITHAYQIVNLIKEAYPSLPIIMGGSHVSFMPEEALGQGADIVVRGEGEKAFQKILEVLSSSKSFLDFSDIAGVSYFEEDQTVHNPVEPMLAASEIPIPDRSLIQVRDRGMISFMGEIVGTRGCPERCVFCAASKMWRERVRRRPLESILTEIKEVIGNYGVRFFKFGDEIFTADRNFVLEFCRRVKPLKIYFASFASVNRVDQEVLEALKEAGCVMLSYGAESGSQRVLDSIKKRQTVSDIKRAFYLTHRAGIISNAFFIIGHPGETEADMKLTYKLAKSIKAHNFYVFPMQPLPGTEMYESIARETGEITASCWKDYFNWEKPIFIPHGVSEEIIMRHRKHILDLQRRPGFHLRRASALIRNFDLRDIDQARRSNRIYRNPVS